MSFSPKITGLKIFHFFLSQRQNLLSMQETGLERKMNFLRVISSGRIFGWTFGAKIEGCDEKSELDYQHESYENASFGSFRLSRFPCEERYAASNI